MVHINDIHGFSAAHFIVTQVLFPINYLNQYIQTECNIAMFIKHSELGLKIYRINFSKVIGLKCLIVA